MRLEIPDVPPSLNKVLRMHYHPLRRLKHDWGWAIKAALPPRYLKPTVKMKCEIILWHSRLYDKDNAYGACKIVVDSLRDLHLIHDDTAEYLDLTVEQVKCPRGKGKTIIWLEAA